MSLCGRDTASLDMDARAIHRSEAGYPARLHALGEPPTPLWMPGGLDPGPESRRPRRCAGGHGPWARARRGSSARRWPRPASTSSRAARSASTRRRIAARSTPPMRRRGRTVAVLGTGIDVAYPERNAGHVRRDCRVAAARWSRSSRRARSRAADAFPTRNSVIAGLADVVVVVEAGAGLGHAATPCARHVATAGRWRRCPDRRHRRAASSAAPSPSAAPTKCSRCSTASGPAPPPLPDDPFAAKIVRGARRRAARCRRAGLSAPVWRSGPARRWWWIWSSVAWLRAPPAGVIFG